MTAHPTVRRRRLAAELRRIRESAELTIEHAAGHAKISKSTLSRIENAQIGVQPRTVATLLRMYGITGDQAAALVQLARDARQHGWWVDYSASMPPWFAGYVAFEDEAAALRIMDIQLVTGLLQTPDYARAVIRAEYPEAPDETIDERIELRMARQDILRRPDPPKLWVILDEAVLCRIIGGAAVMSRQLHHLAALASLPNVTIQVLPFAQGPYSGMGVGFTIMDFTDPGDPTVVYLENLSGALLLDRVSHVETHALAFDHMRATAHSPADSIRLLSVKAHELAPRSGE